MFYKDTEQTLQERCRTLERNYISDVRGYREPRGYLLRDLGGLVEQPEQKPLNYPLADDQQLLRWLVKDDIDESQLKMNRSSQATSLDPKKLVATMHSEGNEHSSHVVLEIVARSTFYGSARRRWLRLKTPSLQDDVQTTWQRKTFVVSGSTRRGVELGSRRR